MGKAKDSKKSSHGLIGKRLVELCGHVGRQLKIAQQQNS